MECMECEIFNLVENPYSQWALSAITSQHKNGLVSIVIIILFLFLLLIVKACKE